MYRWIRTLQIILVFWIWIQPHSFPSPQNKHKYLPRARCHGEHGRRNATSCVRSPSCKRSLISMYGLRAALCCSDEQAASSILCPSCLSRHRRSGGLAQSNLAKSIMVSHETVAKDPVGPTRAIRQATDSFGHSDAQSKRDYLESQGMGERSFNYSMMSGRIDELSKAAGQLAEAQRERKLSKLRAGDVEEWAKSCELQGLLAKDLGGMLIGHPFGERADPRTHVPSSQGQYVCCAKDQGSPCAASGSSRLPYRPYHTAVWPILSRH